LRSLFACLSGYSCYIFACKIDQIGLLPELLDLLGRNKIVKLTRPLMMAAGAASLALESDILEDGLDNDTGQEDIP